MSSDGAVRIMIMAAFCSSMHLCLMGRVLWWYKDAQSSDNSVEYHVKQYALYNIIMNFTETAAWITGIVYVIPLHRWIVFLVGVSLALRIPRSILSNDFHGTFSLSRVALYVCVCLGLLFRLPQLHWKLVVSSPFLSLI